MLHHQQDPKIQAVMAGFVIPSRAWMANHTVVQKRAGVSERLRWKIDVPTMQILVEG